MISSEFSHLIITPTRKLGRLPLHAIQQILPRIRMPPPPGPDITALILQAQLGTKSRPYVRICAKPCRIQEPRSRIIIQPIVPQYVRPQASRILRDGQNVIVLDLGQSGKVLREVPVAHLGDCIVFSLARGRIENGGHFEAADWDAQVDYL